MPTSVRRTTSLATLLAAITGLSVVLVLMLLAFAVPAINSGPRELPIAVAGPQDAVSQVTASLDEANAGAFQVVAHDDAAAVTAAIESRAVIGGLVLGPEGTEVQVASAAGAPYAQMLRGVAAALGGSGHPVTVTDVVPLTEEDPTGAGLAALGLPLVFGGMISAVALTALARERRGTRVIGSLAFSVLAGFATTAVLQFWLGTVAGSYLATSLTLSLGIAAISLAVLGLESVLGNAGVGIAALVLMFVANPLSGMATGAAWLPQPWGALGQLFPVGAAGTAVRSVAFFGGAGATQAFLVLGAWTVGGLALVALSSLIRTRPRAA